MSPNDAFTKTSLSAKQQKCIAALIEQPTQKAAADACGVTARTLQRWMQDSKFAVAYSEAKKALFAQTTAALRRHGATAVRTLLRIAEDENTPPGAPARVAAARALLEFGITYTEIEDLLVRIEKLESERNSGDE